MACKSKTCPTPATTAVAPKTVAAKATTAKAPTKSVAPKKTAKKPAAKAATPKAPAKPAIEFSLFAPDAKEVLVVGEFDNWDTTKNKMRRDKDGNWKKKITLAPGQYEYRFLVDGNWQNDPHAEQRTNPFGSQNSVVNVA